MDVVKPAMVMIGEPTAANVATPTVRATLRHRLEYGVLLAGVALARRLPLRWTVEAGARLARWIGPHLRQNHRALDNLAVAFPDKSEAERRRIARAMWANMGRIFAETLALDRILAEPGHIEISEHARWQARIGEPYPSIGCTLHMGNWELAILPLNLFGRRPCGVYKPLDNPLIDAWLKKTRSAIYPGGLLGKGNDDDDARAGQRTARALIDLARKGGCIGFVSDHFDRRGIAVPFMGQMARFTTAPAMIARHVGARVWLGRCLRLGSESRFRMEIVELAVPRTADKSADTLSLTAAMFAQFEAWIREAPEQWMWWNTRWVKPDGTTTGKSDRA